jgi:hypothetical protein
LEANVPVKENILVGSCVGYSLSEFVAKMQLNINKKTVTSKRK